MIDIKQRVKDLCNEQDITLTELAHKMGISREALSVSLRTNRKKKGNGVSYPSMDTLVRIASALEIDVEDIFAQGAPEGKGGSLRCPCCGAELVLSAKGASPKAK